jgi:hypothetical protein
VRRTPQVQGVPFAQLRGDHIATVQAHNFEALLRWPTALPTNDRSRRTTRVIPPAPGDATCRIAVFANAIGPTFAAT